MAGTPLSNSTSTTGPMTWTTRPTFSVAMISSPSAGSLRAGPGDHLDDLLGDGGLAHLVHVEREAVDHLFRVVAGRVHGRHARPVLRRRRLQHRAPDLDLDVLGQDLVEDLPGRRLVDVVEGALADVERELAHGQE